MGYYRSQMYVNTESASGYEYAMNASDVDGIFVRTVGEDGRIGQFSPATFNKPVIIPSSTQRYIYKNTGSFVDLPAFNSEIIFYNYTNVSYLINNCESFNRPIYINPTSEAIIGTGYRIIYMCNSFNSNIYINGGNVINTDGFVNSCNNFDNKTFSISNANYVYINNLYSIKQTGINHLNVIVNNCNRVYVYNDAYDYSMLRGNNKFTSHWFENISYIKFGTVSSASADYYGVLSNDYDFVFKNIYTGEIKFAAFNGYNSASSTNNDTNNYINSIVFDNVNANIVFYMANMSGGTYVNTVIMNNIYNNYAYSSLIRNGNLRYNNIFLTNVNISNLYSFIFDYAGSNKITRDPNEMHNQLPHMTIKDSNIYGLAANTSTASMFFYNYFGSNNYNIDISELFSFDNTILNICFYNFNMRLGNLQQLNNNHITFKFDTVTQTIFDHTEINAYGHGGGLYFDTFVNNLYGSFGDYFNLNMNNYYGAWHFNLYVNKQLKINKTTSFIPRMNDIDGRTYGIYFNIFVNDTFDGRIGVLNSNNIRALKIIYNSNETVTLCNLEMCRNNFTIVTDGSVPTQLIAYNLVNAQNTSYTNNVTIYCDDIMYNLLNEIKSDYGVFYHNYAITSWTTYDNGLMRGSGFYGKYVNITKY